MIRLLSAGFNRIKKNPLFYIFTMITLIFETYLVCSTYRHMIIAWVFDDLIDFSKMLFNSLFIGLFGAIFVSSFLGDDYYNGAVRNKIIVGCNRKKIYLSNFVLMATVMIFYLGILLIVLFGLGLTLFGKPELSVNVLLASVLTVGVIMLAYTSILVFIGMISSSMTRGITLSMLLSIILLIGSAFVNSILDEPKTINSYIIENGENKLKEEPNPRYPSDSKRRMLEILNKVNPAGAVLSVTTNIENQETEKNGKLALYSLGVIIVFTCAGVYLFDKKDLS